jgi:putative flavoprotein involved in K+ transport
LLDRRDVVVIGAGQAGLACSYWLTKNNVEHVLLERAAIADRWHSQRWDSLHFQFPNWFLQLPGFSYSGPDPQAFAHHGEIRDYIRKYAEIIPAPVEFAEVRSLRQQNSTNTFHLETTTGLFEANHVILATGPFQRPAIPACSASLPPDMLQLHAAKYRSPSQLPSGAVLIVGSGSSGCQIAEELNQQGHTVYFSVGRHRRMPHRYRGKLMVEWLLEMGDFRAPIDSMPGGRIPPPLLLSGDGGGHAINLRCFAANGVRLVGRLLGLDDRRAFFADDLEERLREADDSAQQLTDRVDSYLSQPRSAEPEAVDNEVCSDNQQTSPSTLDFRDCGITTVLWCTGYAFAFDWVHVPILDGGGAPVQRRGVTSIPGLYFVGLHWMHSFASGTLFGVGSDAEFVVNHIVRKRENLK